MTPIDLLPHINEACFVLGRPMRSAQADRMLMAIALQESGLTHPVQLGPGGLYAHKLARGWWQMERGGGVLGVMMHQQTATRSSGLCQHCRVSFDDACIHDALAWLPVLAAGFARLLLWTVPEPLPQDEIHGWQQYLRAWRPGKPRPETWGEHWRTATELCLP